jgi:glycosyltransferase involved in cell wall biosynthesis
MPESPALAHHSGEDARAAAGRRMRVLHVYRRFHPDYTGDGIYYTRLIPHLEARGIANEVLAYETTTEDGAETAEVEGIPVHYLPNSYGAPGEWALLRWLARNIGRFDLVHLHAHVSRSFLSYAFARMLGRPVLFSCTLDDSPTQLLAEYRPRNRPLVRLLMHSISTFVVISPHLLRRSLETVPPDRLSFIPQGVALDFAPVTPADRAASRAALGLGAQDMVLLNVGSVSRRKNIAFLVAALARIPDPAVKLAVVGPLLEEDYVAEIRALMAREGIEDRVILAGFRDDAARWFTAADAFVFASTAEGFPNVYLEAMARSVPIVSTFLPGLTDFIIDQGRAGFMAADAEQFVAAIQRLRADPSLRQGMGQAHRGFAERNLELGTVAARYAALYRRGHADPAPLPDLRVNFTRKLSEGPAALGLQEFDTPRDWQPLLQVVIDTEAHFDWHKGIATDFGEVSSITGLEASFEVFRRHGVTPALLIDHPVATQEVSRRIIGRLAAEGCEVGVHLHPWTTPPIVEIKDDWHSFSGNLGARLERAKLITLTERVAELTGKQPRLFKAGRYGLSPNTFDTIEELGFETDLSICPWYDYSHLGGPDFSRFTARPGWFGRSRRLLSLPTTAAPLGWLGRRPGPVLRATRSPLGRRLQLPWWAQRVNALVPRRLSPEGCGLAEMRAVTMRLREAGLGVFTLSLHSPTLQVGNTPYVRSDAELRALLADMDDFLAFFRDELGGAFTTPSALHARLAALPAGR